MPAYSRLTVSPLPLPAPTLAARSTRWYSWFVITVLFCAFLSNAMNQMYLSNNMSRMVRKGVAITDAVRYRKCKSDRNGWITFLAFFGYLILRLIVELTHRLTTRDDEIKALIKKVAALETSKTLVKSGSGEAAARKPSEETKKAK